MKANEIEVGTNAIMFKSVFDKKVVYTIWKEDYALVRKAFKQSESFYKRFEKLQRLRELK